MSAPSEVTITSADYWAMRPAELLQLLAQPSPNATRTIADPRGGPPDPERFAVVVAPELWASYPRELEDALRGASTTTAMPSAGGASGAVAPQADRLVLTVDEAATLLGISRAFAYEAVNRGEIPSIRIGRRILVPKGALQRFVEGGGADQ
jgi:excisionase family DNA binding protein